MDKRRIAWGKYILSGLVVMLALYLTSLYNYLLFHSIVELFGIAVAWGVFMLAWNARRFMDNNYILFASMAWMAASGLDLLHTLAYKGMGVFAGYDANLPTQLWIAARYLQSVSMLAAPLTLSRRLRPRLALGIYGLVGTALTAAIFSGVFPVCYVEGSGLTPFKIISEYVISAIWVAALVLLRRHTMHFDTRVLRLLTGSMVMSVAAELAFTSYISVYGPANLIGHLFKLAAVYLFYVAVIETGLEQPYGLLFRNLKQTEHQLRQLARAVEQSPVSIVITDTTGAIEYVNPKFSQVTGYTFAEARGQNPRILKSGDKPPEDYKALWDTITAGREWRGEFHNKKKNGDLYWESASISPIVDETGKITRFLAVKEDITERKQIEKAIKLNEERLEALLALSQFRGMTEKELVEYALEEAIRLTGSQIGYFHFVNPDGQTIQLYTWSKGARENCTAAKDPHYPLAAAGVWADCVRLRQPVIHNDYQNLPNKKGYPAGHSHLVRHASVPIFDADKIVAIVGIGNKQEPYDTADVRQLTLFMNSLWTIIKQRRAEAALRESEERFRSVVEQSQDGIALTDEQGLVIEWNRAMEQITGLPAQATVGKAIWEVQFNLALPEQQTPELRQHIKTIISAALQSGQAPWLRQVNEREYARPDGTRRFIQGVVFPIKTERGFMLGSVLRDVTAHKQAEKSLRRSEERYRVLVQNIWDGIVIVDQMGMVRFTNPAAETIMGRSAQELGQKEWGFPLTAGATTELDIVRQNGHAAVVEMHTAVTEWEGETVSLVSLRDITERKQAEAQLKESLRLKEVLLKEIHHRVKNNLQIISSLLSLQSDYITHPPSLALFKESQNRVRTMALIHEKLYQSSDLARIDFAEYIRSLAIYLYRSYRTDAEMIALTVEGKDIFLDIDHAVPCGLIVNELVTNSLKYAFPDGQQGEIRIELGFQAGKHSLVVSDNGVGLPPEMDVRHTDSLGLELVTSLVGQLEGTLELERNGGTTFKITFKA